MTPATIPHVVPSRLGDRAVLVLSVVDDWKAPYEVRHTTRLTAPVVSDCLEFLRMGGFVEHHAGNNTYRITEHGRSALAARKAST